MKAGRLHIGAAILLFGLFVSGWARLSPAAESSSPGKKVAAIVACWFHGSHPDVIFGRILKTYSLDGKGEPSRLQIVSLYSDKPTEKDLSKELAAQYGFRNCASVSDALTLGTGKLAVDGVLVSTEWADYPVSPTGQTQYPKRRLFEEIVKVFEKSGRVVPVFIDKHIADNWEDIKWICDTAERMKVPLMAGSSLPVAWHRPPVTVQRGSKLKEIVGISYHTLDGYGFHGMEMLQCLAERRQGDEMGIKAVQCFEDAAVWEAGKRAVYDPALLQAALSRCKPLPADKKLEQLIPHPVLFVIECEDGLRACLFTLNAPSGEIQQWAAAWRYADGTVQSTLFWLQEERPFGHFAFQMEGVEKMVLTGRPTWPVERTLLTSGALDALLISKKEGGKKIDTPYLKIPYKTEWDWHQPPEPAGPHPPEKQ